MNAEILAVGTELIGSDSKYKCPIYIGKIKQYWCKCIFSQCCGDNPKRLENSIKLALERSDLVVITGGLGPTKMILQRKKLPKFLIEKWFYMKRVLKE